MKNLCIFFITIILIATSFFFGKLFNNDIGRYKMLMHPEVGKFQYLLDTKTGMAWQLREGKVDDHTYLVWEEIYPENKAQEILNEKNNAK